MSKRRKTWSPPRFSSEEEEVRWWDDPKNRREFWKQAVDVTVEERKDVVLSVRLGPRHVARLRELAKKRRMGHVTLLRRVVEEWLQHTSR